MLISKINSFSAIANNYKTKNVTQPAFKSFPTPKECFNKYSTVEFAKQYCGYRGIITYNEIMALKNMSEESKEKGLSPNLAIAFWENEPIGAHLMAVSQDEMNSKKGADWIEITDFDAI